MPMEITELPVDGYEQVVRADDAASGLRAIICVHDTTLGPALGGLRMWPYPSDEAALDDVKRLAKGMTYKSAVAQTGLGGGKAVIIGDPSIKSEDLYLAMGRFIESLGGSYITAEDVNTSMDDLAIVRRATTHVTGHARELGGCGDPSPFTAYGVFLGIGTALQRVHDTPNLRGRSVAIQGVGSVGSALARRLAEAGAKVFVADRNAGRVAALEAEIGAEPVAEDAIFDLDVDIFAPCALGGVINGETIPRLRCRAVAGAANNALREENHGHELRARGILYAPDYVINGGGIIHIAVSLQRGGYDEAASKRSVERIPQALHELWDIADAEKIPAFAAANRLAEGILARARVSERAS